MSDEQEQPVKRHRLQDLSGNKVRRWYCYDCARLLDEADHRQPEHDRRVAVRERRAGDRP